MGATPTAANDAILVEVSIRAPVMGATLAQQQFCAKHHGFNPRARDGRDCDFLIRQITFHRFNPRARDGRDFDLWWDAQNNKLFQSARP